MNRGQLLAGMELGRHSCRKRYISLQSFDCFVDVLFSFGVLNALVSLIELAYNSVKKDKHFLGGLPPSSCFLFFFELLTA